MIRKFDFKNCLHLIGRLVLKIWLLLTGYNVHRTMAVRRMAMATTIKMGIIRTMAQFQKSAVRFLKGN